MAKRRLKLRGKLFVGLSAFGVLALMAIALEEARDVAQERETILDSQGQVAEGVGAMVELAFDEVLEHAHSMATNSAVVSLEPARISAEMQRLAGIHHDYEFSVALDREGRTLGFGRIPVPPELSSIPWFQAALAAPTGLVSGVLDLGTPPTPTILMSHVIRSPDGQVTGLIALGIHADDLAKRLERVSALPQQDILLLDPQGQVAFATIATERGRSTHDVRIDPALARCEPGHPYRAAVTLLAGAGRQLLTAVRLPRHGWTAGASAYEADVLAPIVARTQVRWAALGVVVIVVGLFVTWLLHLYLRPIHELTAHVAALGRGEPLGPIDLRTGDELETLGRTFNEMATSLARTLADREAVISVAGAMVEELSLERVVDITADQLRELTGAAAVGLWRADRDRRELTLLTARGLEPHTLQRLQTLSFDETYSFSVAARTLSPQIIEDYAKVASTLEQAKVTAAREDLHSGVALPMIVRGQLVGVMWIGLRNPRPFAAREIDLLGSLASLSAAALDHATLFESTNAARAELESLIDASPVGIVIVAGPTRVVRANRAADVILGRPAPVGDDLADIAAPFKITRPDGKACRFDDLPVYRGLCAGTAVDAEELVVRMPGDRTFNLLIGATPLGHARGRPRAGAMFIHDLTRIRDYERLREEFISVVAHDLRAPLASLLLNEGILSRQAAATDRERRALGAISRAVRRLDAMVSDLLDASRIEAHRLSVRFEWADVGRLAGEVVERLAPTIPSVRVEVAVEGEPPPVMLDPSRIEQVLTNLLTNAARYSPEGSEVRVTVAATPDEVVLSVADQGQGITPEDLPHVFERFYRSQSAQAKRREGMGVGLYIVHGLVTAHRGRVWVDSEVGKGSTFHVALPTRGEERARTES